MTYNKPKPNPKPQKPVVETQSSLLGEDTKSKPYQLISLPKQAPKRDKPAGQNLFKKERITGKIHLRLTVKTTAFVASGVVAMGSDVSNQTKQIPLIKTSVQRDQKLIIPGSSLKGVIRSTYEAITLSCLCKVSQESKKRGWIPNQYQECEINPQQNRLTVCPACQVFGAMGWQGLIHFSDAVATEIKPSVGFMPSLYKPQPEPENKETGKKQLNQRYFNSANKVAGRKFYYHTIRAVDKGKQQGIAVQQAGGEFIFETEIQFMNLNQAQLGALLIVLGQDKPNNPIALKVGGGKPIGMGTMTVEVKEIQLLSNLKERYSSYQSEPESLKDNKLQEFMQQVIKASHSQLVQAQQMQELKAVLQWPTDREPREGMY